MAVANARESIAPGCVAVEPEAPDLVSLDLKLDLWSRVFSVAPLVLVGTRDRAGKDDVAPKHMAMPLGLEPWFCFACTPTHTTYWNVVESRCFAVTWPRPEQMLSTSLAASRREGSDKPGLRAVPTRPGTVVAAPLVRGGTLFVECEVDRILEGFGRYCLIVGKVVAAHADPAVVREDDQDDADLVRDNPLLAYIHPDRFARVVASDGFPLPAGFSR